MVIPIVVAVGVQATYKKEKKRQSRRPRPKKSYRLIVNHATLCHRHLNPAITHGAKQLLPQQGLAGLKAPLPPLPLSLKVTGIFFGGVGGCFCFCFFSANDENIAIPAASQQPPLIHLSPCSEIPSS